MALPTINLDDRTYAQILEILRSHLPAEYSDHNPSDGGMALLELLTWLGEMELYRMNRIPATHRDKFLKLLVDPPVPVTANLTMRLEPPRVSPPFPMPPAPPLVLPPGLRFATDYAFGRRTLFESFQAATLRVPPAGDPQIGVVKLRAIREFKDELLGVSDGTPNQVFPIANRYVLLDFENTDPGYQPNPRLKVGAVEWELRSFLLTEESTATSNHFMVEEFENQVRFGDDEFGAIPPAGQPITLSYQVLDDHKSLIAADTITHFLNPEIVTGLDPGEAVSIDPVNGNTDAAGGENFVTPKERVRRGLAEFRDPTRLVTSDDFSRVVMEDFNAFLRTFNVAALHKSADTGLVQRAVALMNRKPPLTPGVVSPGHVTILLLPAYVEADFEDANLADKGLMATVPAEMEDRLLTFLEPRRLITTRLHVASVELKAVSAQLTAVVQPQMNTADMQEAVKDALRGFLSLIHGYEDGGGWPLGRTVRRSQLYRLLEDVPGMDHVESLVLSPANAAGDVELNPRQLPVWDSLVVTVKRA